MTTELETAVGSLRSNFAQSALPAVFPCLYGPFLDASLLFHAVEALMSVSRICDAVLTMAKLEIALSGPRTFYWAKLIDSRQSCELKVGPAPLMSLLRWSSVLM
eukprot:CAMPEP_0170456890 /NCGR_PEP_ID=MMETSP0123-20130129/4366_1 /TAXON_ID=182087 /ORGANISM="Favella ehrenbergii, Strain Fehren 1" /LENGTH=103 /DNA_ID=CAMNT_0010720503 /DNA_START=365 /DNA_END=676 /DNA_ORIENTATION=-